MISKEISGILADVDAATTKIAERIADIVGSSGLTAAEVAAFHVEIDKLVSLGKTDPVSQKSWVLSGDSVTYGWSVVAPKQPAGAINSGFPGSTTQVMLWNFQERVLDKHAYGMVMAGGINDINGVDRTPDGSQFFPPASEIAGNLTKMADMALAAGMKVVICSILPIGQFYDHPPERQQRIRDVNSTVKAYAESHAGVSYCNYYDAVIGADGLMLLSLSADGIHPNAAGYSVMLPIVEAAILLI